MWNGCLKVYFMRFYIAREEEIVKGKATDVYFVRTEKILREKGLADVKVRMEFHSTGLPLSLIHI